MIDVDRAAILHIAVAPDDDGGQIAADNGVIPDAGVITDGNITDDRGPLGHEYPLP